jgi:hypothetical protein
MLFGFHESARAYLVVAEKGKNSFLGLQLEWQKKSEEHGAKHEANN